jgi:hypothetical protein
LCAKCGIVAISGERAQGFVVDMRSCSSVGSIKLVNLLESFDIWSSQRKKNPLHKFESSTRTPR